MEIWKDIPGYEGFYQVSNNGRVKSIPRSDRWKEKIMKTYSNKKGYLRIKLAKGNIQTAFYVHQLVAMAFLGHKPNGYTRVVDHINFNISDNRVENIRIMGHKQNSLRRQDLI